jgi:RimJ/RimL family protein N-acetyltransferase
MSLYRRLGFVEEGRLRESRRDGATYHDVVVMGMLEQEWRASRGG